jgi:choline dehydrogenase-like flavoprotein
LLIDARTLPDGQTLEADVCIVGAGPAGLAVALALADTALEVVLVESGGWQPRKETEALSGGEVEPGALHAPLHLYRRRVIGGTSYVWGGRCIPLDPIDFEARDWLPHSGWPIGHGELQPYYARANPFCDAGRFDYDARTSLPGAGPMIEGFASPEISTDGLERFSRPTNLGRHHRRALEAAPRLRLLHDAVVTAVRLDGDGRRVERLELATLAGTGLTVKARETVLAAGTLETVRLMLASRDVRPEGIGNDGGWLGRCYLSHLEGTVGELRLTPGRKVVWGYEWSDDGCYVRRRLTVSAEAQRRRRIGNGIARLNHQPVGDPGHGHGILSAAWLVKNLLVPEYGRRIAWTDRLTSERLAAMGRGGLIRRHLMNVVRDAPRLALFGPRWAWLRHLERRKIPSLVLPSHDNVYPLDLNLEQAPNPDSRLTLGTSRDRFGVAHLRAGWRSAEPDRRTILGTLELFRDVMAASGCGTFAFDAEAAPEQITPIGGHQIGGARMSARPDQGVVDAHCRVHGLANLHLAGNMVFPTAGHANPTLTAVALALRLADRLAGRHDAEARRAPAALV